MRANSPNSENCSANFASTIPLAEPAGYSHFSLGAKSVVRAVFRRHRCKMVGLGRVELPTYGLGNRRSIHLSYSPVIRIRLVYIHFGERCRTFQTARSCATIVDSQCFLALNVDFSLERGSCARTIVIDSSHTGESRYLKAIPTLSSCDMLHFTSMIRRHLP